MDLTSVQSEYQGEKTHVCSLLDPWLDALNGVVS